MKAQPSIFLSILCLSGLLLYPAMADERITLARGRSINIVSLTSEKNAEGKLTWKINYQTDVPSTDKLALREEADSVWNYYGKDVDKKNYEEVVLNASAATETFIVTLKKEKGNWHKIDFLSDETNQLTEGLIREFISAFDNTEEHDELTSTMLYLGDEWTEISSYKAQGVTHSETIDRNKLTKLAFHEIENYSHSRNIYNITIQDGGKSAEVESYESEGGILKEKSFSTTEHSLDTIAIVDNSIVLTKSVSDITSVKAIPASSTLVQNKKAFKNPAYLVALVALFYICLNSFILWHLSNKQTVQKKLLEFGNRTMGFVTHISFYTLRNNRYVTIKYQFKLYSNDTQIGSTNMRIRVAEDSQQFQVGSPVDILYLAEKPSTNMLQELAQPTFDDLAKLNRILRVALPIITLFGIVSFAYEIGYN